MSSSSLNPTATSLDSPLEPERIYYFIHPRAPIATLAFIRERAGGARILGGRSGSHRTGHGESWWDAFSKIVALGYIPLDVARERGIVATDWQPPTLEP